jgi:hypothetical protein
MSLENRTVLIRNAAIAAIVGSMVGGTAGLWSLRHAAPTISIATPASGVTVAAASASVSSPHAAMSSPHPDVAVPPPQPNALAAIPQPAAQRPKSAAPHAPTATAATAKSAAPLARVAAAPNDDDVMERARALARRPDVTALLALREGVVRRAAERGLADSPSVKGQLDELDQRLEEARLLRLKLDAEELRKFDSKRPR